MLSTHIPFFLLENKQTLSKCMDSDLTFMSTIRHDQVQIHPHPPSWSAAPTGAKDLTPFHFIYCINIYYFKIYFIFPSVESRLYGKTGFLVKSVFNGINAFLIGTCPGALPVGFPLVVWEGRHGVRVPPARCNRSCRGSGRLGRR